MTRRNWRLAMVFCGDIFMVIFSWFATFLLYTNLKTMPSIAYSFLPYLILMQGSSFYFCGLYRGVWRFASIPDLIRILKAVLFPILAIIFLSFFYIDGNLLPHPVPIIYGMLLVLFLSGPRILFRWLKDYRQFFKSGQRVLIIGAGNAGEGLVRDLRRFSHHDYQPVAFIDDKPAILGKEIHGVRVMGTCHHISTLVDRLQIELIFIAMPSASSAEMRRVVSLCEQAKVPFRTLPGLKELAEGRVSINALREVSLEDLLGREQVALTWEKIRASVMNKIVLVTGGGGSIGEELCTQLAFLSPASLLIVENSEYNLYLVEMKLRKRFPNLNIRTFLCSVTDCQGIKNIFAKYKPQMIFHAAAYKHVPLLESQLRVAIYNNVIGTRIVAETASQYGGEAFILISTDKAVNPTNIMGATKRAAEIFCQNFAFHSNTRFITVRFGNVLDSAGSVIPLFRKQLQEGGPLTVTHPEMTRFFMTIPEACQLIMQAATLGEGGEIFVLDMGEPIKISYLAEQLIKLSGKTLSEDIEIRYIGLRPGEKLHEELFYNEEELNPTTHPKIRRAKAQRRSWSSLLDLMDELGETCEIYDEKKLLFLLCQLVPEYRSGQDQGQTEQSKHLQLVYSQ